MRIYELVNVFFCVVILKCASTLLQQPIHMCAPAQQQLHYRRSGKECTTARRTSQHIKAYT